VFASVLTGCILMSYGVYLAQLPDWSALWITTGALLLTATFYAALLASTMLGNSENALVMMLRYGDKLQGNRAAMWCFVMLCLSSVTAYFLGYQGVRWYNAHRLLQKFQQHTRSI
jgi:hypothetical protein